MDDLINGFVPGIVKKNEDPLVQGRIKVMVPDLIEPMTPYWVKPAGWPGAGGVGRGSQYPPPPIDGQVYVMFEYGRWDDPEASAIYLTGMYGLKDGEPVNPQAVLGAASPADALYRTCIWEDENFMAYVANGDEKKFIIQTKAGSAIEIDADADPDPSGNSEVISIEGRTGVSIYSKGLIDISGAVVQIQGRRVIKGGGEL